MQYDNNDMDKKLRQLENQSLPDLSKQDEHWQEMKKNLQPMADTRKGSPIRKWGWLIAACLIAVIGVTIFYVTTTGKQQLTGIQNKPAKEKIIAPVDTLPKQIKIRHDSIILKTNIISLPPSKIIWIKKDNSRSESVMADSFVTIPVDSIEPVNTMTLEKFFRPLEQSVQEFLINNKRDTVINGSNGGAWLIPAYAFAGNAAVRILIKEFYSYQDIITNRLTTMSDGSQLVTGGMIHISAESDGKEVNIQPGKKIRWYIPDTTSAMSQMQLFTGAVNNNKRKENVQTTDTMRDPGSFNGINWIAQGQYFNCGMGVRVKVLDLRNEPLRVRNTSRGKVATFLLADKPKMNKTAMADTIREKYGYRKVRIKENGWRIFPGLFARRLKSTGSVGDSAWISADEAAKYNLRATDTIIPRNSNNSYAGRFANGNFPNTPEMKQLIKKFSVEISELGWINCDRFYKNGNPRMNYVIELPDNASNYYTLLVFDKIKSMMSGYISGNQIVFGGIPEGETAKVISVGVHNNKPVMATMNVEISKAVLTNLKFEETTPEAFKEHAATMDK